MSALFRQFETDKNAEVNGVDVVVGINEDDNSEITFTLARMGNYNKQYAKTFEQETKPHRRAIELGTLPDAIAEEAMLNTFVSSVLKGWKNVRGRDGKPLSYSKENAKQLMKDLPELYAELQAKARAAATFKQAELEADAKN